MSASSPSAAKTSSAAHDARLRRERGAGEHRAPEQEIAPVGRAECDQFGLVAHIERSGHAGGHTRNQLTRAKDQLAIRRAGIGFRGRRDIDDVLAAAQRGNELGPHGGPLVLAGFGQQGAHEYFGGHARVGPVNGGQALGPAEDDGRRRLDLRAEHRSKARNHEFRALPGGRLIGGEAPAVRGKDQRAFGARQRVPAIEKLGKRKWRNGLQRQFHLRRDLRRSRARRNWNHPREERRIGQQDHLGRWRAGAQEV
jgi:hypothetical protein